LNDIMLAADQVDTLASFPGFASVPRSTASPVCCRETQLGVAIRRTASDAAARQAAAGAR
jgi:hypothetical protein